MGSQQFCLRWNNHQSNMLNVFGDLLTSEKFVDVTLVCEGFKVRAHKMILSACSPFFQEIFVSNPCKHPVIILKDMKHFELNSILEFMYRGEVNIDQEKLGSLLKSAESLKIKGLAEVAPDRQNTNENPPALHKNEILVQNQVASDEFSPSRKKKKRRKSEVTVQEINRNEENERMDHEIEEIIIPNSPESLPHPQHSEPSFCPTIDSTVSQAPIHANTQERIPSLQSKKRLLQQHEIKAASLPSSHHDIASNPEYVLDPTSFMEQNLTTEQAYVQDQTTDDVKPSIKSSQMILPVANCSADDSHNVVYESENQRLEHTAMSPSDDLSGIGLQYDTTEDDNSSGLFAEPGTSSIMAQSGNAGSIQSGPESPEKSADASGNNANECFICHKTFCTRSYLKKHFECIHSDQASREKFQCEHCSRSYLWKHKLQEHTRVCHFGVSSSVSKMQCQLCHLFFTTKSMLAAHVHFAHVDKA